MLVLALTFGMSAAGCGGGSAAETGGQLNLSLSWQQREGTLTSAQNGLGTPIPASITVARVIFRSQSGGACCIAFRPRDPVFSSSRRLILSGLNSGPGTVEVAGYASDFAPADGVTATCQTDPASAIEACDGSRTDASSFRGNTSVFIRPNVVNEAGEILVESAPFIVPGSLDPARGGTGAAPLTLAFTLADAVVDVDLASVSTGVRQLGIPLAGSGVETLPCDDDSPAVATCSPGGALGVRGYRFFVGFAAATSAPADVRIEARNTASPAAILDDSSGGFDYAIVVVETTPTEVPTSTPTSSETPLPSATPTSTQTDTGTLTPTETPTETPTPTETREPGFARFPAAVYDMGRIADDAYPELGGEIASADFNRDGRFDLAAANSGGTVAVALNRGDGAFSPPSTVSFSHGVWSIFAADVDLDGNTDLVASLPVDTAAEEGSGLSIAWGLGDGAFEEPQLLAESGGVVRVADVNGDSLPDILVGASGGNGLRALLNLGDRAFGPPIDSPVTGEEWAQVDLSVADMNGDGILDVVAAEIPGYSERFSPGAVVVYRGTGQGAFETAHRETVSSYPTSIASADFDGDGRPDVAAGFLLNGSLLTLFQDGEGGFSREAYGFGSGWTSIGAADITGNGLPEIVAMAPAMDDEPSSRLVYAVLVDFGDGFEDFTLGTELLRGYEGERVLVQDLDGDGRADVVVSRFDGIAVIAGSAIVAPDPAPPVLLHIPVRFDDSGPSNSCDLGDLNGDDLLDLITVDTGFALSFLNAGGGRFLIGDEHDIAGEGGARPHSVVLDDLNNDGIADIVTANTLDLETGSVSILLSRGPDEYDDPVEFVFGASGQTFTSGPSAVAIRRPGPEAPVEILAAAGGTLVRLEQTGSGPIFGDPTPLPVDTFNAVKAIVAADLNGDGVEDFVAVQQAGGSVPTSGVLVVGLDDGEGGFALSTIEMAGTLVPADLAVGDVTGDEIPDLVVAVNDFLSETGVAQAALFPGDGDGQFGPMLLLDTRGHGAVSVGVADLDGVPPLDIVLADHLGFNSVLFGDNPTMPQLFFSNPNPSRLRLGDLDGDGTVDVALSIGGDESQASGPTFLLQSRR